MLADPVAPAVKMLAALPADVGAVGAANVPSVPANVAVIPFGSVPPDDVSADAELKVRSAVTEDDAPTAIAAGAAVTPRTRYGVEATVPAVPFAGAEHPAPAAPGPKLHPHQLLVAVMAAVPLKTAEPVVPVFDTMRERLSVDRLVPNGTDSAPPRPPATALPCKVAADDRHRRAVADDVDATAVGAVGGISGDRAVRERERAQHADDAAAVQAGVADTVLLVSVRVAKVVTIEGPSYEPTAAMPPPLSRAPPSAAVLLPADRRAVEDDRRSRRR